MFLSKIAKRFGRDERGVTSIEYAIIGVAISALVVAVFSNSGTLKTTLDGALSNITANITSANSAGSGGGSGGSGENN